MDWIKLFSWAGAFAFCLAAWRLVIVFALWFYTCLQVWRGLLGL